MTWLTVESVGSDSKCITAVGTSRSPRLADQMAELTSKVAALKTQTNRDKRGRFRFHPRNPQGNDCGQQLNSNAPVTGVCLIYQKYGLNARKCIQPCSYSQENWILLSAWKPWVEKVFLLAYTFIIVLQVWISSSILARKYLYKNANGKPAEPRHPSSTHTHSVTLFFSATSRVL